MPPRSRATRPKTAPPRRPLAPAPRLLRLRVSRENALYQRLQALQRNRTTRHRAGEFLVEGVRPITRAVEHGWRITALAYTAGRPLSGWARGVLDSQPSAQRIELAPNLMDALSEKEESSELLAGVAIPPAALDRLQFQPGRAPLVCVFDRPVSPGNLGTLIRSCDALGADGLLVTGHGADVYDPQTVRASQGSLFALPVLRLESHSAVSHWVEAQRVAGIPMQIVGASGEAERTADEVDLTRGTVLVLGNETRGLSRAYRDLCDVLVRIPMSGAADSLNVAVAGAILLYEVARQRRLARA